MPILKNSKNFYDKDVTSILGANLKAFYQHGLLEAGAYTHIVESDPSVSSKTALAVDPTSDGKVWSAFGPSFIWQSGLNNLDGDPINFAYPTTISIDGSPATTGFRVDYDSGRIILDDTASSVTAEFSIPHVDVICTTDDGAKWKKIYSEFMKYQSGEYEFPEQILSGLKKNTAWLPTLVINPKSVTSRPLQMGGGNINTYMVDFHIVSDRLHSAGRLADLVTNQDDKSINLFNTNTAIYRPDHKGEIPIGIEQYSNLNKKTSPHYWSTTRMSGTTMRSIDFGPSLYFYQGTTYCEIFRYLRTY